MSTSLDTYHFEKSKMSQSLRKETPYTNKQWRYLVDNSQVYNTGGLSQVNFNATLYNADSLLIFLKLLLWFLLSLHLLMFQATQREH